MKQTTTPIALGYCALNLVVPGAGFLAARDWVRGACLVALVNGVFLLGLMFNGYVVVPAFSPKDPLFNVVSLLTFVMQAFHGGGCLAAIWAQGADGAVAGLLARDAGAPFADLGAFHLLVAGGLNYFATVKLFDLLTGRDSWPEEVEADASGEGDGGNGT